MKAILEIEQYFQSEKTLEEVLKYCNQFFIKVDKSMLQLRKNEVRDPETCQEVLTKLAGYSGVLKPVLLLAMTEKKNREARYYNQKKEEIEKTGDKFTSASVEREASGKVASYRRVRNLIQGYVDVCEQAISVLQSKLKFLIAEKNLGE